MGGGKLPNAEFETPLMRVFYVGGSIDRGGLYSRVCNGLRFRYRSVGGLQSTKRPERRTPYAGKTVGYIPHSYFT